ncbi:FAD protein [Venustampulla echinocandica]|uniref:FAD protein n=1 Tax=Venustampulla echinocandica TaxID=2656787 RepID=A0A370TH80_9HELO|nr:FAD protein [Venustampulla echinocandica]RDL34557.1 FAD protein [Venustampulla echinocandica]
MFHSAGILLLGVGAAVVSASQRLRSSAFGVPGIDASFDYVVVGGGTAGLTIAARLAETASVAVIEAGGFYQMDNGNLSVVPRNSLVQGVISNAEAFPPQPLVDWGLVSEPQPGAGNLRYHYAQGKTLGGSSALNTMGFHRGPKGAYERWAELVGDQSFTWDNLLPFFKKSCNLTPPDLEKRQAANATPVYDPRAFDNALGGPLQVSWANWVDPTVIWIAKALEQIGLPISPTGFNSGIITGYSGWGTSTIDPTHATRSSSQTSFLEKALDETEIIVYPNTQGMKVLFDSSKKATGVSVSTAGLEYTISATKEVIVSAGVFHSPQLLMVSGKSSGLDPPEGRIAHFELGIGPQDTLQSNGITVVSDLPGVGQNLWDPIFMLVTNQVNTPSGPSILMDPATSGPALADYLDNASGPYSSAGGHFSFEKIPDSMRNFTSSTASALAEFPADWPEIEYDIAPFPGPDNAVIGGIGATLTTLFSRGSVSIASSSMATQPLIDLGWLSNPADVEILVAAFKRCRQLWNTDAANSIKVGPELVPGATVQTDEEIATYIRSNLYQIFHASATCAMGKSSDPMAVLDSGARVYGVQGLRVVDASSFPFAIPGHPQASVYMLAEKIADAIKKGN